MGFNWKNAAIGSVGGLGGALAGGFGLFDSPKHNSDGSIGPQLGPSQAQAIQDYFKQYLGRDATQQEVSYLDNYIRQGHLSAFEVGQIVQSLPEAQNKNLQNYGQQYAGNLAQNDNELLSRAGNQIGSTLYQQGRPQSSSYAAAFANAARDLALQRQQSLSSFYGQGYQSIMGNTYNQGQAAQGRGYNLQDEARKRNYDITDYYRQKNDFQDSLHQQGIRNLQQGLVNEGLQLPGQIASLYSGGYGFGSGSGGSSNAPSSYMNAGGDSGRNINLNTNTQWWPRLG